MSYKLVDNPDCTPESVQHLVCDVCGKQIESLESCLMLATDPINYALPKHYIIAHLMHDVETKEHGTQRISCARVADPEFTFTHNVTYPMIYQMSLQAKKYQKKYKVLQPA
jgi:hypothetical protein